MGSEVLVSNELWFVRSSRKKDPKLFFKVTLFHSTKAILVLDDYYFIVISFFGEARGI